MKLHAASGLAPGHRHERAMEIIAAGVTDPVLGRIGMEKVQLCPQHSGGLDDVKIEALLQQYPDTDFRLHASPRVEGNRDHYVYASNAKTKPDQVKALARTSQKLGADGYSLHSGLSSESTLEEALDTISWIEDLFQCPVGIEGLYPAGARKEYWLINKWDDYQRLLESGVRYAIDLSHLQIVAFREKCVEQQLVEELLASPACIEIHVSDNNGRADSHRPLSPGALPWWKPILDKVSATNELAPVFYEGMLAPYRANSRS